ncbi:IS3 family transposase [Streptomyces sp. NPDC126514]|uniref:IS3 family transposase n=1 Tax=Streptomyces sp. NPDC126514 TaxID=3155210 RepID=UPI0033296477
MIIGSAVYRTLPPGAVEATAMEKENRQLRARVKELELEREIRKAFDDSDSTYGHRRIHAQLHRWGHAAGPELVRRLMRELGLQPCQPKPKRVSLT